jgi:hypothetical protein
MDSESKPTIAEIEEAVVEWEKAVERILFGWDFIEEYQND